MYHATQQTYESAMSRSSFITKTYLHLFAGICLFVLIEGYLFTTDLAYTLTQMVTGTQENPASPYRWLAVLGAFMLVSWFARGLARSTSSKALQYLGLIGYVAAEAVIFAPLLVLAQHITGGGNHLIVNAAVVSICGFLGLTLIVFMTRKDFSFLKGVLMWGGILALIAIGVSVVMGATLGLWFSVLMIGFAGAAILYDTSNVLHHYPEGMHVAAALELFASLAILFWYVLRLLMAFARD